MNEYHSLDDFLQKWNNAGKKDAILMELESQGILLDELQDEVGKDLDSFDDWRCLVPVGWMLHILHMETMPAHGT